MVCRWGPPYPRPLTQAELVCSVSVLTALAPRLGTLETHHRAACPLQGNCATTIAHSPIDQETSPRSTRPSQ